MTPGPSRSLEERLSEIRRRMQDEAGERAREEARAEHEEEMARQDREELEYQKRKKGEEDHYSPHREERNR